MGTTPAAAGTGSSSTASPVSSLATEVAHYVVTAHPPGGVLLTCKCNFLSPTSQDVLVAKSRRLEVRQLRTSTAIAAERSDSNTSEQQQPDNANAISSSEDFANSPFPVVLAAPIHGRLTSLLPLRVPCSPTSYLFMTTDRYQYAVVGYDAQQQPHPFVTHASGSVKGEDHNVLGRPAECGPLVAMDPHHRCIALHLYDGLLTILPVDTTYAPSKSPPPEQDVAAADEESCGIHPNTGVPYWKNAAARSKSVLKEPFHARMEERTVLAMTFLQPSTPDAPPQLTVLHQDSRGTQHIITHVVDLKKKTLQLYGSSSSSGSGGNNADRQQGIDWLKRTRVDGGSSLLIPVPPSRYMTPQAAATEGTNHKKVALGGVIILGQRQITFCNMTTTKVVPVPPCLFLCWDVLPDDPKGMPRFLLSDEFGNLHMLQLMTYQGRVIALTIETLGSCALASAVAYLGEGLTFVGSTLGDSQLVQIHEEPIRSTKEGEENNNNNAEAEGAVVTDLDMMDSTYLTVVEEYTHLGPIVDFDLVPTAPGLANNPGAVEDASKGTAVVASPGATTQHHSQSQVVTASGTSRSGSIRLIRNGIGMNEYASVEMPGIQNMWSVRASWKETEDSFLVQSFVGQTRVLGVSAINNNGDGDAMMHDGEKGAEDSESEDAGGTLEEVVVEGLDPFATTLYVGNVYVGDRLLQITESEIRLIALPNQGAAADNPVVATWRPDASAGDRSPITVASANEAGQAVVALRGGIVWYFCVENNHLKVMDSKRMEREVSCLDVHPFATSVKKQNAENLGYGYGYGNSKCDESEAAMDMEGGSSMASFAEGVCPKSAIAAVGLWDDFTVRLLSLDHGMEELHQIHLSTDEDEADNPTAEESALAHRNRNNMMARSLCLVTLDFSSSSSSHGTQTGAQPGVDMLFVGLGDGSLVSFAVVSSWNSDEGKRSVSVQSKKEVCLGTQRINLIPLQTELGGTCVLATGDRPTVIYLAGVSSGGGQSLNPKLCYSNVNLQVSDDEEADTVSRPASQQTIAVNVAAPFYSSLLFDAASLGTQYYSLCVADDANLRLGVIDDIQKLHVTTCRLGMSPRRIVHCPEGRMFAVGCIESGIKQYGLGGEENNMGNCIRFLDDTTFDDISRIDLEPYEMILSLVYASLRVHSSSSGDADSGVGKKVGDRGAGDGAGGAVYKTYLLVGTAFALPDEDEPTRGRILVIYCGGSGGADDDAEAATSASSRSVRQVAELQVRGGVYSMCQFYEGKVLATVNSKTHICQLTDEGSAGGIKLSFVGVGHHGHILTLFVKSQAGRPPIFSTSPVASSVPGASPETQSPGSATTGAIPMDVEDANKKKKAPPGTEKEMLAIVGDMMRSISVVQYYPQHEALEEIARDFNTNWTTAMEMLTDDVYLGAENWNNLFVLRRNTRSQSEEIRCRLDTIGEFHLGEMCNKFMRGSLVMPHSSSSSANSRGSSRRAGGSSPGKKKSSDGGTTPTKSSQTGAAGRVRRPAVTIGSQTLFGTVDGTLGSILGLDVRTAAFFSTLERSMTRVIRPVGNFSHQQFRAFEAERRCHPSHGFVDGDLVESFLDLDRNIMEAVVRQMNRDGGWEIDRGAMTSSASRDGTAGGAGEKRDGASADAESGEQHVELTVDDVVAMVEEMAMLH